MGNGRLITEVYCIFVLLIAYHMGILGAIYMEKGGFSLSLMISSLKDHYENSLPGFATGLVLAWLIFRTSILHRQNIFKKFLKILFAGLLVASFTTLYFFIKKTFFVEGSQWPEREHWIPLITSLGESVLQGLMYSGSMAFMAAILFTVLLRKTTNS